MAIYIQLDNSQILTLRRKDNIERISQTMKENIEYYSIYMEVKN